MSNIKASFVAYSYLINMATTYFIKKINFRLGSSVSLSYLLDDIFLKDSKEFIF